MTTTGWHTKAWLESYFITGKTSLTIAFSELLREGKDEEVHCNTFQGYYKRFTFDMGQCFTFLSWWKNWVCSQWIWPWNIQLSTIYEATILLRGGRVAVNDLCHVPLCNISVFASGHMKSYQTLLLNIVSRWLLTNKHCPLLHKSYCRQQIGYYIWMLDI